MKSVIIIAIAFVFLFVPQTVFGFIPVVPEDYVNETPTLDWGIMFVTTTDKCYSNHEKALDFYASLTQQYFNKFKFDHNPYFVECITDDVMPLAVEAATNYGDLTIVIPDYLMSVKDRHTTGSLGHYGFYDIKTIVSQAETLSTESKNTGWTLSHELAHFALDWKEYGNDIKREAVHKIQKQYNDCKSYDTTLTNCAFLWESIQTPSKKWIPIMSPSYAIKIAESMKPVPVEPTCPSGTVLKNGICTSIEQPKIIQKYTTFANWGTIGKTVYDNDWVSLEGSVWANSKYEGRWDFVSNTMVKFYNNGDYLGGDTTDSQGNFKFDAWLVNGINNYSVKYDGSDKWYGSTTPGPTFNVIEKPPTEKTADSNPSLGITYSVNGVQKSSAIEGDELCIEYGLNMYYSGYSGPSSPMKFEKIRITKEIVNDYYDSIIDGPFTTWHTTDGSGKVNFCETLITPEGYWAITYRYSAQYPGGSVAYSNAPTLSMYFEQDPNNPYESEQEREQRELNARLVEEAEIGLKKQQELDELQRAFDKLEQEKIHEENILKLQIAKQEREQKEREELQEQKEREEHDEQLRNEVKILQSQAHNDLKLMHAVDKVEEELKKISSDTTEQKIIINKAWDLLKINKQKIADMEYAKKMGDKTLSSKEYKSSILNFEKVSKNGKQVDSNLNEISKSIKQIEKMQEQTCFLFWCW
ncbi:MAG: hypothetical protein H8D35_06230 [Nitrosopumilus sp.]|nr:hypothetical protein [Nitrosopumilus sp.]